MTLFIALAVLARHYSLHGGSGGIPTAIYHLPNQVSHRTHTHNLLKFAPKMASNYNMLPPPPTLDIHDTQAAEKWKRFKRAWTNYSLATGLSEKAESVQVATLLTVISSEAREVFSTFSDWDHEGDDAKIQPVLAKFEQYCQPRKNIPFERYRFNRHTQEPGETYDKRVRVGSVRRPSTTSVYLSAIELTHDCALRCYIMYK